MPRHLSCLLDLVAWRGDVPHSRSLTGPGVRVDPRDLDLAEIIVAAGRDISTRLGASPEHAVDLDQTHLGQVLLL